MPMKSHDVIVVGAGIVGASAAYFLARQGVSVALIERDEPGTHASGKAFGMVSAPFTVPDDAPAVDRLHSRSIELHQSLPEALSDATSGPYHAVPKAGIRLALDAYEAAELKRIGVAGFRADAANVSDRQDLRWLEYGALSHIEARISEDIPGGLYMGGQLELSPGDMTRSLTDAAVAAGADLLTGEVSRIKVKDGSANGVETTSGDSYTAGKIVLAAGPWCGAIFRNSPGLKDVPMPIGPLKGQIVRLGIGDEIPMPVSLWWGADYAATKNDGLMYIGTTEEDAGFDAEPTSNARLGIRSSAERVLPFLKSAAFAHQTACLRPVTPDRLPVVGPVAAAAGLLVASGGGRSGIELGPGMGELAARYATEDGTQETLSYAELSPGRFG